MIRTIVGLSAVVAAVVAGYGPAAASPPGPHRGHADYGPARDDLTLGYAAAAGFARAVKLTCDPAGGGHPDPVGACTLLERTGADPDRINPAARLCFLIYAPVTAEITGTWHGATVKWSHTYGNTCEMRRATGVLFKF